MENLRLLQTKPVSPAKPVLPKDNNVSPRFMLLRAIYFHFLIYLKRYFHYK